MTDPIRAALERLVELDARYAAQGADTDMTEWDNAIAAARAELAESDPEPATKLQRPKSFEFALDFLGSPENDELRAYIEQLEARAADLLEQRHPAPVPVTERLPGAEDCRMPDGSCWWFDPHVDGAWYFDTYQGNYTHWLPAHALPLPAGEVQP